MSKQKYIIGGAVRDVLLGNTPKDIDWLAVGYTHTDMVAEGFKLIEAQSFPVYHHPETGDEYALARTERKVGVGYHGFECDSLSTVTLADDQMRRDLTINQFAVKVEDWEEFLKTHDRKLVHDQFNGLRDLDNRTLRHISTEHFSEDPIRFLRVCRFAARYNFAIADETSELLTHLANNTPELRSFTKERLWLEIEKALGEVTPLRFFTEMNFHKGMNEIFGLGFDDDSLYLDRTMNSTIVDNLPKIEERMAAWMRFQSTNHVDQILSVANPPNNVKRAVKLVNQFYTEVLSNDVDPFDFLWMKRFLASHGALKTNRYEVLVDVLNIGLDWEEFSQSPSELGAWIYQVIRVCCDVTIKDVAQEDLVGLEGKAIGDMIEEYQVRYVDQNLSVRCGV